jgi:hypothetical protein
MTLGSFRMGTSPKMQGGGRRTIGYRYEESAIPVGRDVYVLGEAADSGGALTIRKPSGKGTRFIVSLKSEEALVKGARTGGTVLTVLAAIAAAAGLLFAALGILGVM